MAAKSKGELYNMDAHDRVVERAADALTGTSLFTWAGVSLAQFNQVLETLTLLVGLFAGIFALFFHARRWLNERKLIARKKDSK